jgi:thioesterase domain-containing protein/ubiquinone/menaquinone biosynthesis C-methylase UbiE/acyl carrier protein
VEIEEEILFGKQYVVAELKQILADKIKVDPDEVDENVDLQDFGIDSMVSGMIMQAAQEKFDAQVPLNAITEHPTLSSLAGYIYEEFLADDELPGERRVHRRKRSAEEGSGEGGKKKRIHFPPELLPIHTKGSGQPSFWVHGAAGYSAWFQNLSEALGPEFPIYAFQARGTDGFSMPHTLEEMVDHYVHCVRLVQPEGPYVLGGYSFGGLIAIEMARKLHEEGETIRHLVMFDTYPATQEVFDRHFGNYDDDFLQFYLANYFLRIDENPELAIRQEDVAHIPERLRLAELAKLVKERGQTRISADEIYKYLRGGLVCSEHAEGIYQMYPMRPYDASDLLFFKATDGFTGRASAVYWESRDILAGYDYPGVWKDHIAGEVQVVELDSDHLNMLEEPTLTPAARHIEALLREPPPFDMDEYLGFKEAFDQVTRFGHELLAAGFRGSGALPEAGESFRRADLHEKLAVLPEYGRLFHASVDILEREGFVRREGERLVVTPELEKAVFTGGEEEIAARIGALSSEHPEIKDYLPLLRVCQGAVLEVMNGSRDATDVMFPGGSMKYVAELYKGNLQTDFYNRLVAERVQEYVRHHARRYPHSKVQLFEVGAGTGGTSVFIFQALAQYADKLRYIYTDIGSAFLQMSKQQFGAQYPYIDFLHFDVEKPPEAQGFEPHSMDVVVASNVLHTTHHIDVTLRTCARLLKPGGVIVINELTQRLDYNTLTFGLTTGWWLYEDEELRIQGSPLLTNVDWARMLKKAGFGEVEIVGVPGIDANDLPQSMIAATKQAPTPGSGEPPAREAAKAPAAQTVAAELQDLVAVEGRAAGERAGERAAEEGEAG